MQQVDKFLLTQYHCAHFWEKILESINFYFYLYVLFLVVAVIEIIILSMKKNWKTISYLIILCLIVSGTYYSFNKFAQEEALLWERIDKKLLVNRKNIERGEKDSPYKIETNDSFIIVSKSNMVEVSLINKNNWIENNLITRGQDVPSKYGVIYNNEEKNGHVL